MSAMEHKLEGTHSIPERGTQKCKTVTSSVERKLQAHDRKSTLKAAILSPWLLAE